MHNKKREWLWTGIWKAGLSIAYICAAALVVLSTPLAAGALVDGLQIFPSLKDAELAAITRQAPVAIVILAAGRRIDAPEFGGETVDEISLERVRYGAHLAHQMRLPVLVSGGLGIPPHPPLAKLMADLLVRDYGVIAKWQETKSGNTAENAIYSSAILKQAGISHVVLVTHAWHMKRARAAFVANGMSVTPAPTAFYGRIHDNILGEMVPSTRALRMSAFAIHETVGAVWYRLKYGY